MALAFLVIKLPCNLCVWFSEVEVIAFFLGWGGGGGIVVFVADWSL